MWRSDDGGQSWSHHELGAVQAPVLGLAISSKGAVWAGTAGQGLWTSQDGGETWKEPGEAMSSAYVTTVRILDEGQVYVLADGFLSRSLDGGRTWQSMSHPGFAALSFAIQPGTADHLYLGSRGRGLAIGDSGGEAWSALTDDFLYADITCLETDPANPGVVYAGTRYHGLYRTIDGGNRWSLASGDVGTPLITALAKSTAEPQTLYAGTLDGVYRSDDGAGSGKPQAMRWAKCWSRHSR